MQVSRKNVVQMNQFGRPHTPMGKGSADLVGLCGELAAKRLSETISNTLNGLADEMLEVADRTVGIEMRRYFSEAAGFARDRSGTLEAEFRKLYFQRFLRICRRDRSASDQHDDLLGLDQLSLVESDQLEETLATGSIANAIDNLCGEEMFGLAKRIGVMLDDPDLELCENPLAARVIADSFMELMQFRSLSVKSRLALVPVLNKHLPPAVRQVYQEINQFLVKHGVLPTIRVSFRKPAQETVASRDMSGNAPAISADSMSSTGQDLLAVLQQLLAMGRATGNPAGLTHAAGSLPGYRDTNASPGGQAGSFSVPVGPTPVFVQTLTQLQRGKTDALAGIGLDSVGIADGHVNVLNLLRNSGDANNLPQVDAMTLDIVAMVFDYILDDQRIPDAMKALIGRLQIPVLKVAMLDRTFFSQKTHAARRLLDALAGASIGWNEEEGHDGGLYRKIDQVVQTILNQFDDQIDVFVTVLDDFLAFQLAESRHIDSLTSRSAKIVQQREELEIAGLVATDEIRIRVLGEEPAPVIHEFLFGRWQAYLSGLYTSHGEGSEAWSKALSTIDDLLWSVKPKISPDDRRRLVGLLPDLLNRLETGLHAVGEGHESCNRFFSALVKCHAEAVRAGLRNEPETPAEETAAPPSAIMAESAGMAEDAATAATDRAQEFETIPELDEVIEPEMGIGADLIEQAQAEEPLVRVEPDAYPAMDPAGAADTLVQQLRRGTWIEFDQEDGSSNLAKLAWVSPRQGIYLFTNRLGQRAMSIRPEGLASKFREGKVRIVDNMPLVDRAMNNLVVQLQGNV